MAVAKHWRVLAGVVGVYFAGLVGVQQYYWQTRDPEYVAFTEQRVADDYKQWDEAKEAGQPTHLAASYLPYPTADDTATRSFEALPYSLSRLLTSMPRVLSRCSVRTECVALSAASLRCQDVYQRRGADREMSMRACAKSVDAYKECQKRKSELDSRRYWMDLKYAEHLAKQRGVHT